MLSSFKRKSVVTAEITFKHRVERFWNWYAGVAPRFYLTIQSRNCSSLTDEVSAKVDEIIPGFAWVFGPGDKGQGHSFTLSGEGNLHRQLLSLYWLAQARQLDGWTFYAARQPGSIKAQVMEIGGRKFNPLEFWITPVVNREEENVDMTVWHPLFDLLKEQERWTVLFLFLDDVLGEYGTQQWIAEIKLDPRRLADSIPLEELGEFLERVRSENGWKKLPPGERAVLYQSREQHARFLRDDIVTGTTMHPRLISEYLKAEGGMEDPLKGTGAEYVFVAFGAAILAVGHEADARGEIENALDKALRTCCSGRLLRGAWGTANAYIDLLLFDGPVSLKIVQQVLREQNLPAGSSINYFAKRNADIGS